ncbi:MAG: type III pantothenate kinase [Oscillospiraceae bacterium]|nr:type III pantothenate kinase [Oscillospiraceae bacterium]
MVIVIDIGNTNMEFGIFYKWKLINNFRIKTNRDTTSDEIGIITTQFLFINKISIESIKDIVIASVVPQINYSVANGMLKYFKKSPLFIGEDIDIVIENAYENQKDLGADRLVNSYQAYYRYKCGLIVVDFGTATTFDVVNNNGKYLGGVIYPGIKISLDALFQNTAKLSRVEISEPKNIIGTNTISSMQSGIIYGYVGAVKNIVLSIQDEFDYKLKVIATGGLSKLIGKYYSFDSIDPHLTIEGLISIYLDYINKR